MLKWKKQRFTKNSIGLALGVKQNVLTIDEVEKVSRKNKWV